MIKTRVLGGSYLTLNQFRAAMTKARDSDQDSLASVKQLNKQGGVENSSSQSLPLLRSLCVYHQLSIKTASGLLMSLCDS